MSLLENWQAQLEELLALSSIYGDEAFRVLVAASQHGLAGECSALNTSAASSATREEGDTAPAAGEVDLEGLLAAPPPASVTALAAQHSHDTEHSSSACSASSPQCGRAQQPLGAFFLCEAVVHVDMPAAGVQLVRAAPGSRAELEGGGGSVSAAGQECGRQPPPHSQHPKRHTPQLPPPPPPPPPPEQQHHQEQQQQQERRQQQQSEAGHSQQPPGSPPTTLPHTPTTLRSHHTTSLHPMSPPLHHLPPVHVQLTLPATYPSHTAPRAHVSAVWLSPCAAKQLEQLCGLWQPGSPVLYEWLDWLQVSALSHLGVHSSSTSHPAPLILHPPTLAPNSHTPASLTHDNHKQDSLTSTNQSHPESQPAGSQDGSGASSNGKEGRKEGGSGAWDGQQLEWLLADVSSSIQRYAASRARALFGTSTCLCQICYDETLGAKCVLLECGHAFCVPCMSTFFRTQLKSGQVEGMRCPDPTCREPVAPYHVQALLRPDEYAHWEMLLLQRTLDKMDDVVYCPRCQSTCLEDKDHCAECPSCMFAFCGLCLGSWHPGVRCMGAEERLMSMARRHPESDIKNQMKSLELIKGTTKKCPGCGADIERSEGCNKMRCTYCDTAFCYRCGKEVTSYDHFSANTCPIFDRSEVDRLNAMFGGDPAGGYAPRGPQGLVRVQFAPCVVCGQLNFRENGNNLIRCGACTQYSCYLCKTWLRSSKPGLHFGPSRCKQHT